MTAPSQTVLSSTENPHAGQGSVLLDIGGDVGALVVVMPAAMEGVEVEINRIGDTGPHSHVHGHDHGHDHHGHDHHGHDHHGHDHHDHGSGAGHDHRHDHGAHDHGEGHHRPHVAVVARPTADGPVHSLVYPELRAGRYELYRRPAEPVELTAEVRGGEVTEVTWPGSG